MIKSIGVDQGLTKMFQIDPKLTFDNFHILNHGRISKIEKIFDGTDPPKKSLFFGGGSGGLKAKDLGYSKPPQGHGCTPRNKDGCEVEIFRRKFRLFQLFLHNF